MNTLEDLLFLCLEGLSYPKDFVPNFIHLDSNSEIECYEAQFCNINSYLG
jgi:hypothetical protein